MDNLPRFSMGYMGHIQNFNPVLSDSEPALFIFALNAILYTLLNFYSITFNYELRV